MILGRCGYEVGCLGTVLYSDYCDLEDQGWKNFASEFAMLQDNKYCEHNRMIILAEFRPTPLV